MQQQPLLVVMDPRVTMSQTALQQQYRLAQQVADLIDRSAESAAASKGNAKAAQAFEGINEAASFLLDEIDGADAPPTAAAVEAAGTLEKSYVRLTGQPPR